MTVAECARISYLGYPVEVTDRELRVLHPETGRVLFAGRHEFSTARRFIRGYRKPLTTEAAAPPRQASATASDTKERTPCCA